MVTQTLYLLIERWSKQIGDQTGGKQITVLIYIYKYVYNKLYLVKHEYNKLYNFLPSWWTIVDSN